MAGTVVPNVNLFTGLTGGSTSNCDAITDWSGTPTLDIETFVQGTGAMSKKVSNTTSIHVFSLVSALDLSNTQLYVWAACGSIGILGTKAAGGFRIRVEDASANWGEWYMAGKDTWTGAWDCFMIHTTTGFSANSATLPTMTAITKVGVVFYTTATAAKINCWWDALRYGTGLAITAGTEGDPATFQDFVNAEGTVVNKWGVITVAEGILQVQGQLDFGSTISGSATYFKDISKVLVFRDRLVPATFYRMLAQGNIGATTKVRFGTKSGESGISGCMFRSAGAAKFQFTAIDSNITELGIYGSIFFDAGTVSLPAASGTAREVLNTNFESCAKVLADTCKIQNCNFISSDANAILINDDPHNVTDCKFIGCPRGVELDIVGDGSYDFYNLQFSGCTYDVNNSSSGTLTVNKFNGSNPSTYIGSIVTFVGAVDLKVTVVDKNNQPIGLAQTAIYRASDNAELMNKDTDVTYGTALQIYTGSTDPPVDIYLRIRKSSVGGTKYIPASTIGVINPSGFSIKMTLQEDPNA